MQDAAEEQAERGLLNRIAMDSQNIAEWQFPAQTRRQPEVRLALRPQCGTGALLPRQPRV